MWTAWTSCSIREARSSCHSILWRYFNVRQVSSAYTDQNIHSWCLWKDVIRWSSWRNRIGEHGIDACGSGYEQVAGCCEHGNESLDFVKCRGFLKWLLKKNFPVWVCIFFGIQRQRGLPECVHRYRRAVTMWCGMRADGVKRGRSYIACNGCVASKIHLFRLLNLFIRSLILTTGPQPLQNRVSPQSAI